MLQWAWLHFRSKLGTEIVMYTHLLKWIDRMVTVPKCLYPWGSLLLWEMCVGTFTLKRKRT